MHTIVPAHHVLPNMHFSQTLDAGLVPEWKSQYVNYDQGKRLIGKLEKSAGVQLAAWDLPPPAQDLPTPGNVSTSQIRSNTTNETTRKLIDELGNVGLSSADSRKRQPQFKFNERSPLLDTPNTRLYRTPQTQQLQSLNSSIPLQHLDSHSDGKANARKQFFTWLNAEVSRANSFYATMENESYTKLLLLEAQLNHFMEHRKIHHDEIKAIQALGVPKPASKFFQSLDLPSLPVTLQNLFGVRKRSSSSSSNNNSHSNNNADAAANANAGGGSRITRQSAHTKDFTNKDDHVSYYQAKQMLRTALSEYYESLLQLRGFQQLNQTAIRKIVKKFDKQLHTNTLEKYLTETQRLPLRSQTKLNNMILKCENLYADTFTRGNHKQAVDSLNIQALNSEEQYNTSVFATGLCVGGAIPLVVLAVYAALHYSSKSNSNTNHNKQEVRYLLQIYGAFALIGLMMLGFGAALAVWSKYKINYPFIIELDRATMLNWQQFAVLPAVYVLFFALCGWLSFNTVQPMHRYYPCIFLGMIGVGLLTPFGPYWKARRWLVHSLWRLVFSGLYAVEFRDLLMGDIMCSLTYTLSTMELFFCIYSTPNWWSAGGAASAQRCTSSHSRALGFLNCLPGIWRFMQCLRRYADTLDWFPHLLNAAKYTFTILYYMSLSLARISPDNTGMKAMFIVFAAINGVYTACWDVFMDFSLAPSAELRPVLVFPKWTYWCIMVLDPLMRHNWVLYAVFWNLKEQGALISFVVALIEASRRILWVVLRVENEHAANISRCRAFKDLHLPYDDVSLKPIDSSDLEQQPMQPTQQQEQQQEQQQQQQQQQQQEQQLSQQQQQQGESQSQPQPHQQHRHRTASRPIPGSAGSSAPSTPFLRRTSTFSPMSPRIQFAHTNDFQRRKPKPAEVDDDDDEEDD